MVFNNPMRREATVLPHPEEPMNPSATLANINVEAIITKWLTDWGVPKTWWSNWKGMIVVQVYDVYPASVLAMGVKQDTPAATWSAAGKRYLAIKPGWLNAGVIAHEQAHNSYAYLNANQKSAFSAQHTAIKNSDPTIKHLFSINTYGLSNDVEGHAEIYRYIGQQMPAQLKPFYPMLF